MMNIRVKLKRSWTVIPSRERIYYRVLGTYHKLCEQDMSNEWTVCYVDSLDVPLKTRVDVIEIDINAVKKISQYEVTNEGLIPCH